MISYPIDDLFNSTRQYHERDRKIKYNYMCPLYKNYIKRHSSDSAEFNRKEIDLMNLFRELWEQHGAWTRMTIMSIVFSLPDEKFSTNRLLQNPVDFEKALQPFYGSDASSKFSDLLKAHLIIAAELVKAAKAGDTATVSDAEIKWYQNADEIAALLGSINPYWYEKDWREMMHQHLSLVKSEAVSLLNKNYEASISVYDKTQNQALMMADVMSQGIIKQFPNEFMM